MEPPSELDDDASGDMDDIELGERPEQALPKKSHKIELTDKQIGQTVRNDGPETHLVKAGTPTMGGGLIIMAIALSAHLAKNQILQQAATAMLAH